MRVPKFRVPPTGAGAGYVMECPACTGQLQVDNSTAILAERTRWDAMIHLLWHSADLSNQGVFPGTDVDLPR